MRCPDCNKFVAYDTEIEPEEEDNPSCTGIEFSASYRRVLACAECGTELKEGTVELSYDFAAEVAEPKKTPAEDEDAAESEALAADGDDPAEHEHVFEVDNCDAEPTTDTKKTRHNALPDR